MKEMLNICFSKKWIITRKEYFYANLFLFCVIVVGLIVFWITCEILDIDDKLLDRYLNMLTVIEMVLLLYPWMIITWKRWKDFCETDIFIYFFLFIIVIGTIISSWIVFAQINSWPLCFTEQTIMITWLVMYLIFQFSPTRKKIPVS